MHGWFDDYSFFLDLECHLFPGCGKEHQMLSSHLTSVLTEFQLMLFAFGIPPERLEKPLTVSLAFVHHHHYPDGTATFSFISYRYVNLIVSKWQKSFTWRGPNSASLYSVFGILEMPFGLICASHSSLAYFLTPLRISQPVQHKLLSHRLL